MKLTDFYIYIHIKRTTGEPFYVGKGKGYRAQDKNNRNKFWHNIVKKHGYDIVILKDNIDEVTAFILEEYWIKFIGRRDLNNGTLVNMSDGGDGEAGKVLSIEHKAKIAKAHEGKTCADTTKYKISIANKDKPHKPGRKYSKHKKHKEHTFTDETRKKLTGRHKDVFKVIQIDRMTNTPIKTWHSHHDAAISVNSNNPNYILDVCRGIKKSHKKFYWQFC